MCNLHKTLHEAEGDGFVPLTEKLERERLKFLETGAAHPCCTMKPKT
jgi:hypothetical protein